MTASKYKLHKFYKPGPKQTFLKVGIYNPYLKVHINKFVKYFAGFAHAWNILMLGALVTMTIFNF